MTSGFTTPGSSAPCRFEDLPGRTILNALSAHIAILDRSGIILDTNKAWEGYAQANGYDAPSSVGINYLSVCDGSTGEGQEDAHAVAAGIRAVIRGEKDEFLYDYPCHGPSGQQWFYMRAIRMNHQDALKIVISHEDITALKLAEAALKESKRALETQKKELEEANVALRVLLKQYEKEKQSMEQDVLLNLRQLVLPYLEKLKIAPLRPKDKTVVEIIDARLNDIISPLLQRLSSVNMMLTPQEMQIAMLVKDGKSSKEIADITNVAETTVHFHRKNLRQKLGLKNTTTNLRAYLMSLS